MTAAQFENLATREVEELLLGRFECLVYHGCTAATALVLATHVELEVLDVVDLLERGCPEHLLLPILG